MDFLLSLNSCTTLQAFSGSLCSKISNLPFAQALTSAQLVRCLCKTCIYGGLKAAGNLSIFNKAAGGQVNCCFQPHFSLSEHRWNKKLNECFLWGLSSKFTNSIWRENGGRVFFVLFLPSVLMPTRWIRWTIICSDKSYALPFCPASVQLQSSPWAEPLTLT